MPKIATWFWLFAIALLTICRQMDRLALHLDLKVDPGVELYRGKVEYRL